MCVTPLIFKVRQHQTCEVCDDASLKYGSKMIWVTFRKEGLHKYPAALDDPKRDGSWDRRGLVVGEVQSGKTANYTGLICKAADAGYKLIIVLAGMFNDLRAQTQQRLDEGFIGYDSKQDLSNNSMIAITNKIALITK